MKGFLHKGKRTDVRMSPVSGVDHDANSKKGWTESSIVNINMKISSKNLLSPKQNQRSNNNTHMGLAIIKKTSYFDVLASSTQNGKTKLPAIDSFPISNGSK